MITVYPPLSTEQTNYICLLFSILLGSEEGSSSVNYLQIHMYCCGYGCKK